MKKTVHIAFLSSLMLLLTACAGNPTMYASMYSSEEAAGLRQAAYANLDDRDLVPARLTFERLLIDNPKDIEAIYGLGSVELFSGNFEKAVHRYETAVPSIGSVEAYNRWGVALTMTGQLDNALAVFNHALTIEPEHLGVLINRALAKAIYGRPGEAIDDIRHASNSNKGSQYANQLLLIHVLAGREDEVARFYPNHLPAEYEERLRRALAVREISTPEHRARYIGLAFM